MKELSVEDKELLFKDLSARLLYGVFCSMGLNYPLPLQRLFVDKLDGMLLDFYEDGKDYQVYLSEVKPYLRSMDDMTEEELKTYHSLCYEDEQVIFECGDWIDKVYYRDTVGSIDYLNSIHIDYRGLIEKGLALVAPDGMYN